MKRRKAVDAHCAACGDGDGEMFLHSRCHFGQPLAATLLGNVLALLCHACGRRVARFEVARVEVE